MLTPEETAVELPRLRALAIADATTRGQDGGPLGFVPTNCGDDPEAIRRGVRERLGALAEELEPERLLLAHGPPVTSGARAMLAALAAG